ncbi:right-handed parallel beta-helix repeat-containing protein, partial [Halobellus ordinarius]|uniref:right-handed parallel beta-helix repeat-containing protein n=1 Tax=Halobellus ordinarius TaxID=3075120 RepID=UPI0028800269
MSDRAKSDGRSVGTDYRDQNGTRDNTHDGLLDRRGYLKMAGAAVATVAATTGTVASAAGATRRGIEFDRVVDAVDDLGLDSTGGTAVNDQLESALTEGTLVRFPEGEYKFDDTLFLEADRVGFLGEGDARFRPTDGFSDLLITYVDPPDEVLFENIDIDMRADGTTTGLRIFCRNHFHIQDTEFLGRGLTHDSGQVSAFILGVASESGRGVLRNAVAKKGSRIDGYAGGNGRIGIWVGWSNKGTVRIENCDFREFGNNGTYTSRTPGQVEIVNSYFLNNNAANVRIGGEGSYVENCTIEFDMEKYTGPELGDLSSGFGLRGIHIDQGVQLEGAESIPAGAEVRDCEVIGRNAPFGIALVNLSPQGRSLTLKNTRLKVDIDKMWAVRRGRPGAIAWREYQRTPPEPHWIRMENVSITGSAASRETIRLVGADGCVIRNCCINQTGINRDGVYIVDSDNCVVEDSTIDVTGDAIDLENSTVDTASITREGSCPLPETDDPTNDTTTTSDTTTSTPDGKKLEIDGGSVYDRVNYTFSVDGSVEPGAKANDSDTIDGTTVDGHVEGGIDNYWITGDFTSFEIDADIPVRLDGETVDPDNLVVRKLEIDGGSVYDRVNYTFSVDGSVEPGPRANDSDTIDGTTVDGHVEGGIDNYWVTGDFTSFEIDADIPVRLDGETVNPDDLVVADDSTTDGSDTTT